MRTTSMQKSDGEPHVVEDVLVDVVVVEVIEEVCVVVLVVVVDVVVVGYDALEQIIFLRSCAGWPACFFPAASQSWPPKT